MKNKSSKNTGNKRDLDWILNNISEVNIAELLDDSELSEIASEVWSGYSVDTESRREWMEKANRAMELAKQVSGGRMYAGEATADVMYPLISTAAIQYSSRALSAIMKPEEVVKHRVIGRDPDGLKAARGVRVSNHMNYQILEQMDDWDGDMDKLLVSKSILGCYFKKIYFDTIDGINKSIIVSPIDLVINYYAKSMASAPRKTHILEYSHNQYLEHVNSGLWMDIGLLEPSNKEQCTHVFLEQHTTYDLDGDGYAEPYIITINEKNRDIVRIVACYDEDSISINDKTENIVKIVPKQYFVKFGFMPSFDGGFYDIGFGVLLSPINESMNTILNQLIDAGTFANRQCGFIGNGVKLLRGGESGVVRFKSGEWKMVQSMGGQMSNNIVPLPVREPSMTLFQLLGMLMESAKELSSRSDLLSGTQSQHNVPATTTLALIEQGLQVFGGIYKRVFKGLKAEFKMLFELNKDYLDEDDYLTIVDDENATIDDYRVEGFDIVPVSTNSTITDTQKYVKAQAVREWYGQNGINSAEIIKYYFEALEIPDAARFIAPPPPPQQGPTFQEKIMLEQIRLEDMKLRLNAEKLESEIEINKHKEGEIRSKTIKNIAVAESQEVGTQIEAYQRESDGIMQRVQMLNEQIELLKRLKEERKIKENQQGEAQEGTEGGVIENIGRQEQEGNI